MRSWRNRLPVQGTGAAVGDRSGVVHGQQVQPAIVHQIPNAIVLGQDAVHGVDRRFDDDVQAQGLVLVVLAIVDRLPRQADPDGRSGLPCASGVDHEDGVVHDGVALDRSPGGTLTDGDIVRRMSENLKMLAEYSDAMFRGDTDAVFNFWAPEFVSHVTARVAPGRVGTDVRGEEQVWWREIISALPDMEFTVGLIVESDDLVVSNWTVKGTHTGTPFFEVAPSGNPVEINGTAVLRIRDGKIVEHWGGPHCQLGLGLIQ